jgi:large subunit ribosomal protein L16
MFQPKKTKYKKYHKGKFPLKKNSSIQLKFGFFGLKCLESCRLTSSQIEAFRQNINRKLKKKGKIWINVFPDLPVTSKPSEVRMGKGKGSIDYWVTKISSGRILFEVSGIYGLNEQILINNLKSASQKLPIKTCIVQRYDY